MTFHELFLKAIAVLVVIWLLHDGFHGMKDLWNER